MHYRVSTEIRREEASLDGRADLRDLAALRALDDACLAQNYGWWAGGRGIGRLIGGSITHLWRTGPSAIMQLC